MSVENTRRHLEHVILVSDVMHLSQFCLTSLHAGKEPKMCPQDVPLYRDLGWVLTINLRLVARYANYHVQI